LKHPRSLVEQIKAYIDMILLHLFKQTTNQRRETTPSTPVWSPPPEGTAVVNVDAALFFASSRIGVGVVIRSHNGDFLAAHSQVHNQIMTPKIAESRAVRCAVALARDEGLDKIIIVSDCLSVIQRIKAPGRDRSLIGVVIEDIKILARLFSSVTFRHVSRLCNNSAHILARRAELYGSVYFRDSAPECIREKLCIDVI
jgi:ribonuclease HI